jgi:hypothetical protein
MKSPPNLKANSIKFLGYVINFPSVYENQEITKKIIDKVISQKDETNINVSIRNSWALANIACILGKVKGGYENNKEYLA